MAVPPGLEWVTMFEGVQTLEARIALTAAILVLGAVAVKFVSPALVRWLRAGLDRSLENESMRGFAEGLDRYAPWWLSIRLLIRILQVAVVSISTVLLLLLWGQLDLVIALLGLATVSMPTVAQFAITLAVFLVAYISIDVVGRWLTGVTERSEQFSRHQEEVAYRVLQIVVLTGAGLVVLSLWGADLGGLLIGAGFLGIVAGMAAQQTLGSLIAGFVLMFSRPFEIGDWVEIGDEEGIVTEITIVNTRLENFDGEFVVLPNDVVGNETIINRSMKGRLRIRVEVGIDYEADPDEAQEVAVEALKEVDEILAVPRPQAVTSRLADSAVVLELRFWIDKPSARRRAYATSAAIRAVKDAFDEAGIKIPFPQRELMGREESSGFRVIDSGEPASK